MKTVKEVLEMSVINGNVLFLPDFQLDRKLYTEVAKAIGGAGGKWNRKEGGFVFNPVDLASIKKVIEGEKVNLKKEFQFFETPAFLAKRMVEVADLQEGDRILEPSAFAWRIKLILEGGVHKKRINQGYPSAGDILDQPAEGFKSQDEAQAHWLSLLKSGKKIEFRLEVRKSPKPAAKRGKKKDEDQ